MLVLAATKPAVLLETKNSLRFMDPLFHGADARAQRILPQMVMDFVSDRVRFCKVLEEMQRSISS